MENVKINDAIGRVKRWMRESVIFKILVIGFIMILLLIPQGMVKSLVSERSYARDAAIREVAQKWGSDQVVQGPYLNVPVTDITVIDDKEVPVKRNLVVMPENLDWSAVIDEKIKKRGIYKVLLYESLLNVTARFDFDNVAKLPPRATAHWDKASVNVLITDLKGVASEVELLIADEKLKCESGVINVRGKNGVHSFVSVDTAQTLEINGSISLNGSQGLYFEPLGRNTNIRIQSDWPSPKYTGYLLPKTHETNNEGFDAHWNLLDLNRSYPSSWLDDEYSFGSHYSGVELIFPVDHYLKNHRAVRYSFLVVAFVFLLYLLFEIQKRLAVHPMQYILVGLNLSLFFSFCSHFPSI